MYHAVLQQAINSLQTLSSDELRDLLGDDAKLDERVDEVVKSLESTKEEVINENRTLAEANLVFEPQMIELRSRVQELADEGQTLGLSLKKKTTELKQKSDKTNSETVLALLQTAAAESEEESENIVKMLLDGELTVDAYLEKFMGTRKQMHTRKLKSEKMAELLRQQGSAGDYFYGAGFGIGLEPYSPPVAPTGFYVPPISSSSPASVPYPVGSGSIPMPAAMFQRSPY